MRLVAQVKAGFYPAAPEAIAELADRLFCADAAATALCDPCCGKAAALNQLRVKLAVPAERTYLIELDSNRARAAKELLPEAHLLAGADFIGTETSARSFGLVWLNPPFDDEMGGGGRVEQRFLAKATPLLVTGGILCFILPAHVLEQKRDIKTFLLSWYRQLAVVPFAADHRPFNEVCVFGVRRSAAVEGSKLDWSAEVNTDSPPDYEVPPAGGPARFLKTAFTEDELCEALGRSRLNKAFRAPPPLPMPRPGLQLGQGQQALVLAGGFLNRVLQVDGKPPVLIKATPYKKDVHKSTAEDENEDGSTKTTTIMGQKIGLRVRVLDIDGEIHTLQDVEEKGAPDAAGEAASA